VKDTLRRKLRIPSASVRAVNDLLLAADDPVIGRIVELVQHHGGPGAINRRARKAGRFEKLMSRLRAKNPGYARDVEWLVEQRDRGAFVPLEEYRRGLAGGATPPAALDEARAVTLEISALQYFPWLIAEAKRAIEKRDLMPGRYIRVRRMKEQEEDGDLLAVSAAMQVLGASRVETLDTKGTDGSNVHLGGPATITGYFGGVGQPNDHPVRWAEELLYYYMEYGVDEVLNVNAGTILIGYLLYRLGVDVRFKISVYMGNDNPYAVLWTLLAARLFARKDGSTPLIGFNFSNSVDAETIRLSAQCRKALGLEQAVRFEHHIVETWKSIVVQPYDRLNDLLAVAPQVANISAKHEGGVPAVEPTLEHPSDILDYFMAKEDVLAQGLLPALERNYLEKHVAVNRTAAALLRAGIGVIAAPNLHRK
jgi:hypothetical protein